MLKALLMALQMAPAIIQMVHTAEQVIPGRGKGKQKLDLVLDTVQAATSTVPDIAQHLSSGEIQKLVTDIAGATVSAMNAAASSAQAKKVVEPTAITSLASTSDILEV